MIGWRTRAAAWQGAAAVAALGLGCADPCGERLSCGDEIILMAIEATSGAMPRGDLLVSVSDAEGPLLVYRCNIDDIDDINDEESDAPCQLVEETSAMLGPRVHVSRRQIGIQAPALDRAGTPNETLLVRVEAEEAPALDTSVSISLETEYPKGESCNLECFRGSAFVPWDV